MPAFILNIIISFVVRQVVNFSTNTDWNKVKADADARISALFHIKFLGDAVTEIVNNTIDCLALALQDANSLAQLAAAVETGNWNNVYTVLIALLTNVIHPSKNALIAAMK
jgi:hypothetical protein